MADVTLQERLEEATEDLRRCQVAGDVAAILRVEGVQGERRECRRCPISVLVMKRLGPMHFVEVGFGEILAWGLGQVRAHVQWSVGVEAFIAEFDGESDVDDPITGGWDEFAVTSP